MSGRLTAIAVAVAILSTARISTAEESLSFRIAELISDPDNLVFQEDFADPSSVAKFVFASPDHWQRVKVGDRWVLEHTDASSAYQPPHRSPHNIALIADHKFGSFVLDYDAQQTGREYGHRDACVFFNFVDPTHYYYTHIATKSDPHAHQVFTVNDAPRTAITAVGTDGFDWGSEGLWHHVRVVRDLATGAILVYVDQMDKPIMQANDKSHGQGYIGFGSFDDTGRVTNIRVYSTDAATQRPNYFRSK